jgi:hypothetical protein
MFAKYVFASSGTRIAMTPVRPVMRLRAARFSSYPSSAAASSMRRRVSGRTISGRASARDAVDTVTPARFATSTSRTASRGVMARMLWAVGRARR